MQRTERIVTILLDPFFQHCPLLNITQHSEPLKAWKLPHATQLKVKNNPIWCGTAPDNIIDTIKKRRQKSQNMFITD